MPFARPREAEPLITKSVHSAFIGTELADRLRRDAVRRLVLFGIATDHCVSTSARHANNLGWEIIIVSDACATFDRKSAGGKTYPAALVHEVSLASLRGEFAELVTSRELIAAQ
jgi:nicotinamidase-related amidase